MPVSQAYQWIAGIVFSGLKGERPAPKPRVLSAELHPDIQFLPLYHDGEENQRYFCLWSFLWSKPLLCHFQQPGEIQQTQVLQGFAAFCHDLTRIPPRHSQTRRATNCATPGYLVFYPAGRILPNQARYQLRYTRIFNLSHYITAVEKIKELFCLWSLCDQTRSHAAFGNRSRSHKTRPSQGTAQIGQGFCHEALLLYRLPSADASIICDGKTVFLRLWGGRPSWPRAPGGYHRAAFWRSTMRFPLLRPP